VCRPPFISKANEVDIMTLNVRPILSALLRNRTGAVLVAMQIALALAILVNAVYVVKQRVDSIDRPTGIDDRNMFAIETAGFTSHYDPASAVREDMAYLRGLDAVVSASASNAVPLSGSGSGESWYKSPDRKSSEEVFGLFYEMDEQGLRTLGAHLIAGREFRAEEILPPLTMDNPEMHAPEIIVTRDLARELFPQGNALGKTTYDSLGRATTVIGVVDNMEGPWPSFKHNREIAFAPRQPLLLGFSYLVRTKPGQRDALMRIAAEHLPGLNPNRVVKSVRSVELYKDAYFLPERITAIFLVVVTCLLIAVAALGIFGLATFNVSTRTKQIGTRRAVGARKRDIIRHFMVENALVTTTGVVVGCALALGVGYGLSLQYKLPRLDLYYLVGGVLLLWTIGQLAAWQPARRAATVSPSIATRTA
jgi:putative ABC transport system permease protein